MTQGLNQRDFHLDPEDNARLANLCGPFDEHLRQIELRLGVEINHRGGVFQVIGDEGPARATEKVMRALYEVTDDESLSGAKINLHLAESGVDALVEPGTAAEQDVAIRVKRGVIKGRGANQERYLHAIANHDINFGVGPAGTGKTYLAVASAVEALEANRVQRLLLVRPAVEAGEKLGFLPGDLSQKVDPYLRPLYDALYDMVEPEVVVRLMERGTIEVAPLAYMRGRTLNDSFIILDEAQNTTPEQMKMFLTRLGFGSKVVVTGDVTQIDLPEGRGRSGLMQVRGVLEGIDGLVFVDLNSRDVVRHRIVQDIVDAYERDQK